MQLADALYYVRRDIGDPAVNFLTDSLTDGITTLFDMPEQNINPAGLVVQFLPQGSTAFTVLQPTSNYPAWNASTFYEAGQQVESGGYYFIAAQNNNSSQPNPDGSSNTIWTAQFAYLLDSVAGKVQTFGTLPVNSTLVMSGQAWGLFTDLELTNLIYDASRMHCQGQTITQRYRTEDYGFITYRDIPKDLDNLPKQEEQLVVALADINCFWVLANDSVTDVNLQTAEGTNIDRSARYSQIMEHITALTGWYNDRCAQWNVGFQRMESMNLRRVSRTTGRLVPIFRDREYDDHRYPERELPQIDRRDTDVSGVPSPIWNGSPL